MTRSLKSEWFAAGVDIGAATEHKIKVARIPGCTTGNAVACAEMAIYLTLGVLRKQVWLPVYTTWKFKMFLKYSIS
jgi:phosphoglycerate dehydrogenase-like enzyme